MTKLHSYLFIILFLTISITTHVFSQEIEYESLFTETSFNDHLVDTTLPVGATAGSAAVNNGSSSYIIPIEIPAGTNGVVPDISIAYNSQGVDGHLGYGWSINASSTISRGHKTFYHDGEKRAVKLDAEDVFHLDGMRLLKDGANTYVKEIHDYGTVEAMGNSGSGPLWFKVQTKSGVIMHYGNGNNSSLMAENSQDILFWKLSKVIHLDGNYIDYVYTDSERDHRLVQIKYTGNTTTGLLPYNSIDFNYLHRGETSVKTYEAESSMNLNYLLDNITIKTVNDELVKKYEFKYGIGEISLDNNNAFLNRITEVGSDNLSKLNPTIFKYGNIDIQEEYSYIGGHPIETEQLFTGDFNGDGLSDKLIANLDEENGDFYHQSFTIRTKGGTSDPSNFHYKFTETLPEIGRLGEEVSQYNFFSGDYTGEGRDDVLYGFSQPLFFGRHMSSIRLYDMQEGANSAIPVDIDLVPGNGAYFNSTTKPISVGDFNGDGIMDVVLILADDFIVGTLSDFRAYIYYGNISTQFEEITLSGNSAFDIADWGIKHINVIDIDGDGRNELMVSIGDASEIYSIDELNVVSTTGYALGYPTEWHLQFFGDFNGDRKTDIFTKIENGDNANDTWRIGRSNGKFFVQDEDIFTWISNEPEIDEDYQGDMILIGDFNGDGKSDIGRGMNIISYAIQLYLSSGNGWGYHAYVTDDPVMQNAYGVQDFNGDGKADIINRLDNDLGTTMVYFYRPEVKEFHLNKIKNGHGQKTTFNYSYMTGSDGAGNYDRTEMTDHPINTIELPMLLPTSFYIDGLPGNTYKYENAKLNKEGKGFLGFEKITVTKGGGQYFRTFTNNTLFEDQMIMLPTTIIQNKGLQLMSTKTITNTFTDYISDSGKNYFTSNVTATFDDDVFKGRQITTSTSFDPYGNAYHSEIDLNGDETKVTDVIFGSIGNLPPDRPLSTTTTTSRPGTQSHTSTMEYEYNPIGQLIRKTSFPNTAKALTHTYLYENGLGNVTKTTLSAPNESDRVSVSNFDSKGRWITSAENALQQVSSASYDNKWAKPTSTTGINTLTNSFQYDAFGRLTKTTVPEGYDINETYTWGPGTTSYKHKIIHPGAPDITTHYDKLNRVIKKEEEGYNGLNKVTTIEFDVLGNVISTVSPSGFVTTTIYDAYNRPKSIQDDFATATIVYDYVSGNKKVTTTKSNQYHGNGELATTSNGTQILVETEYDIYGRQKKLIDINAGTTQYNFDAFGQLREEISAGMDLNTTTYNKLGMIVERTYPEGNVNYTYFNHGPDINLVNSINSFAGDSESFSYDDLGRVASKTLTMDGTSYTFTFNYDDYDNVLKKQFPSGFELDYTYDINGYLETIKNLEDDELIFENIEMTELDQPKRYRDYLNNTSTPIITEIDYNHSFPIYIKNGYILDHEYNWDYETGNLISRTQDFNFTPAFTEDFTYDNLNRLTGQSLNGAASINTNYSSNGNIIEKIDAGQGYEYDENKINAVNCITTPNYDNLSLYNQTISYTSFFQPYIVNENSTSLIFTYGSDLERIKSLLLKDGGFEERRYMGDYETYYDGTSTTQLHYVNIGRGVHMIIAREGGTDKYYRTLTDYQGSIMYVGDTNGEEYRVNYDAWGRSRSVDDLSYIDENPGPAWLNRGYTGHEHMDDFKLINMNGRMYDPLLGRMLSPDNNIQLPFFSQNYNRYSYVLNNPLKFIDPDGEFFLTPFLIGAAISVATNGINNKLNHQSFFDGAGKAAIFGAIGGGVSSAIGAYAEQISNTIGRAIFQSFAHGYSGGMLSAIQGGEFASGFASGAISSISSSVFAAETDAISTLLTGGLTGGIGAKAAGGEFWNGVGQGLITTGLNHLAHSVLDNGGEGFANRQDRKVKELLTGVISEEQYLEWHNSQGVGAAVGISLLFPGDDLVLGVGSGIYRAERVAGGLKILGKITRKEAIKLLRQGKDVYSDAEKVAKNLMKEAGQRPVFKEVSTGKGMMYHYHDLLRRIKGHSFFGRTKN